MARDRFEGEIGASVGDEYHRTERLRDHSSHAVGLADVLAAIAPHPTSSAFRRPPECSRDRARFATWSNNRSKRGTAGRIRSAPEAPANASVIGRLALAILRMPALATSAGAIHRVAVAALDRLPALATYAYVHHAPPYRCHGGGFTPEFDLMTSARWHHSATDGENALSSPTRSRWIASPRSPMARAL
jgi:hypothetical protein